MRHFLIITCFAALAWATAPAALAQADLPTVESEVEPSLEPDEAGPGATAPLEEVAGFFNWISNGWRAIAHTIFVWLGGDNVRQGNLENGALGNSLSDPVTILRFVATPFAFWLLKNLISYSFLRIHVLRSLYADIEYRLRFTHTCITNTERWLQSTSGRIDRTVPFLGTAKEEHIVYPTMQSDIRECTWSEEVTALRILYRGLDEIEVRLGKIENCFSQMVAHSRRMDEANIAPHVHNQMMRRYRSEIQENLSQIKEIYRFWKKVGLRSCRRKFSISAYCRSFLLQIVSLVTRAHVPLGLADKKSVYRHVASSIFVGFWVWHLFWVWVPAVIVALSVFVLFWGPLLGFEGFEIALGVMIVSLFLRAGIGFGPYRCNRKRIRENVLELEDRRWNKQVLKEKRTPRDI